MNNKLKIFEDHIQKRIEELNNQINLNCLNLWNEYKPLLDEALMEGVVEYETLRMQYETEERELNESLENELKRLYETCVPVKVIDFADIYFAHGVH